MNRRRLLVAMTAAVLGSTIAGCSSSNPNEQGFETQGHVDPNIPANAEDYEKKFSKEPAPGRGKKGRPEPSEI